MMAHRRTLIVWVVAALIGSAAAAIHASTLVLSVGSASGTAGSDVRIPLSGTGAAVLGAVQFELAFDPAVLQIKAVEAGSGWPGAMIESNVVAAGRMRVAAVSSQAAAGDGELFVLVVAPLEGGEAASPLEVANGRAWEHATNFEMLLNVSPGRFTRAAPQLMVRAVGTAPIQQMDVIKNQTFVFTARPGTREASFEFLDNNFQPGQNYYYVRVLQQDGQLAWSSPIWIKE